MGNIKFATESRNGIDGFSIQYNDYPKSYYFGGVENLSSDADEIFFQKEGKFFIYSVTENSILINGADVTANGASTIATQLESDVFPVNTSGPVEVTVLKEKKTLTDAQIKTLPTTPFELVEAPGSGKKIIPNYGYAVFKTSNGAYTNLGFDGANGVLGFFIRGFSVMPYAAVANALNGAGGEVSLVPRYRMFEAGDPEIGDSNARAGEPKSIDWPLENAALTLSVDNYTDEYALDLGNFTGGHADNTLEITVFYSIVDL